MLRAGTTLRFNSGTTLTINGSLKISGNSTSPVTLTSSLASPTRGSWIGIVMNAGSAGSEINAGVDRMGRLGVNVIGAAVTVRNSTIRNFSVNGILLQNAGSDEALIEGNLIDNLNDAAADCVEAVLTSPTIIANRLTNCNFGLHLNGSNSVVNGNNVITGNNYGIQMWGRSGIYQPVVNGNQIYANDTLNARAEGFGAGASSVILNYHGNWWGSTAPTSIATSIQDLSDGYTVDNVPWWISAGSSTARKDCRSPAII